jgi:hypothetical protein
MILEVMFVGLVLNVTFNNILVVSWWSVLLAVELMRGRIGRDRMIVGFTTTCEISAYHH